MLTLNDGRSELWQWDTGRKLTVDADCSQVHFSNKVFGRSVDVDVVDGLAIIPDILLQTDKELTAWAFIGTAENGYTKISKVFKVNKRNKPADYVFTPPEKTTLGQIVERLDYLEEMQNPDAIKEAVNEYLANNPIKVEETDPTVPDWAKQPSKPKYTAEEVGALQNTTKIPIVPTKVSAFENDKGYLTQHQDLSGYAKTADLPKNLPNPYTLTLTGAVNATYDGSKDVIVDISKGGGIDVTGAKVGQTIVVKAVDETGKPTEWEAVSPSAVPFRFIRKVIIPEDITKDNSGVSFAEAENGGVLFAFDTDKNGNFFELNEIIVGVDASTPNTSNDLLAITKRNTPGYSTNWVSIPGLVGNAGATKKGFAQITGLGDGRFITYQTVWSGGAYSNVTGVPKTEYVGSSFKAICLQLSNGKGWGFSVGSKFEFWGR